MLTIIGAAHYIFGPTKKRPQHRWSSVTSMDLCIIFIGTCQDRSQERSKNDLSWQMDRHVSSYLERIQPSPVWTNYIIFQKPWNFLYEHFGRIIHDYTMYKSHGSFVKWVFQSTSVSPRVSSSSLRGIPRFAERPKESTTSHQQVRTAWQGQ